MTLIYLDLFLSLLPLGFALYFTGYVFGYSKAKKESLKLMKDLSQFYIRLNQILFKKQQANTDIYRE
jgi:hypothetical protein